MYKPDVLRGAMLLDHLLALKNNDTSQSEICFFYTLCYNIALTTIRLKYSHERKIFIGSDLTCENLAADALTPLFFKRSPGEPIGLLKSLLQWKRPVVNEEEANFFINKVVWNRVAQFMTKMLKDSDPTFNRIHRSIKYFIGKNNYNIITYFGTNYITLPSHGTISGRIICNNEFDNLPNYLFYGKNGEILVSVFDFLKNHTDFFPALPLNLLVKRIKLVNGDELLFNSPVIKEPRYEEEMDINNLVEDSLKKVYHDLDQIEFKNSEAEENIKTAYKLALKDISKDLMNGGVQRGLYHYFKLYLKNLEKDDFYKNYYYLMNIFLDQLRFYIKAEINFWRF